jgi:LysM repeat protein
MSLLNGFQGKVNDAKNFIKNPFSSSVNPPFDGHDFPDGFIIREILENGEMGEELRLFGNMMPKIPFTFGGSQRIKKESYAGYSEPVVQVLGSEEDDVTINGEFKEKSYNRDLKGVAQDIQQLLDAMRLRGNLVHIALGEWERYGIISKTKWDMEKLSKIQYSITFLIIGFQAPTNARFAGETKEVPFAINRELIQAAQDFQEFNKNYPDEVPRSIGEQLNAITNEVASAVATVTGFVDSIVTTVQDIQKSITRAKGLIKYAQNKLNSYKELAGGFQPFNDSQALTGKYKSAKFYQRGISNAAAMTALLEKIRAQLVKITPTLPLGRHLVISGDNLQKISVKFYGTADHWKKIYDYNRLNSTELTPGRLLEIPKI